MIMAKKKVNDQEVYDLASCVVRPRIFASFVRIME